MMTDLRLGSVSGSLVGEGGGRRITTCHGHGRARLLADGTGPPSNSGTT